ncbi:MAG: DNA primase, partial [Chloroflexota bacterium]|nr:DNA primase [Chloroflexota bacterium]
MARDPVAEVRERTDIVELVGSYVQLKRAGRSYKGLCPFHQEKTPSFVVFPDSGNFHCFGCGKGGDAFTFYQQVEHVEFREALQELARRAGVELASAPTAAPEVDAHRQRLIELNELAAAFYANILTNSEAGAPGRAAAAQRGLSPEIVARFGLGYALDRWDALLRYFSQRGIDPALAHEAGLLQERDSGGYYDRFRGRFMFPIRSREGRVVGFGARVVGEGQPKYLNSPQSAIFDKSALVYGLDLAKDEARKRDQIVVVEGYMDAIAAHQFGHANVVAAMGTAFTEAQVGLVKRLSKHIVLALDADAAGQMATLRSLETMQNALDADAVPVPDAQGIVRFERKLNAEIAIVRLPDGKDPDELIRKAPEAWPEVVAAAQPFLDFYLDAVTTGVDRTDARAKAEAVKRAAPVLEQVADRVVQSHYVNL